MEYCNKCQVLSFANDPSQGPYPAGGNHGHQWKPGLQMLPGGDRSMYQRGWKWCNKCQGRAFAPNGAGRCPAGGGHSFPSGDYSLPFIDDPFPQMQSEWRWCSKCQGLAFAPNGAGHRPAGGGHVSAGSGNDSLLIDVPAAGQTNWKWCHKC
jgi:hypothetical protein